METYIHYHYSPLGWLKITASEDGLTTIQIGAERPEDHQNPLNPMIDQCCLQLDEYFKGSRKEFDLEYDMSEATDFYKSVWAELLKIPFGKTSTYGQISKDLNQPKASQAVGQANGKNPLAIVVPCHRVVGTNGKMTGYASGIDKKIWLLKHERDNSPLPPGQLF